MKPMTEASPQDLRHSFRTALQFPILSEFLNTIFLSSLLLDRRENGKRKFLNTRGQPVFSCLSSHRH